MFFRGFPLVRMQQMKATKQYFFREHIQQIINYLMRIESRSELIRINNAPSQTTKMNDNDTFDS